MPILKVSPRRFFSTHNFKRWIKRYWAAEVFGTSLAIFSAVVTFSLTKSYVLSAIAGTYGENLGFYFMIITRDIYESKRHHKVIGNKYTLLSLTKNITSIVLEFGPAEILDSFFTRPFFMFTLTKMIGDIKLGTITGKLIADIFVYVPVVISYEIQRHHKNKHH